MKLSQVNRKINQYVEYYEEEKWTYEQTLVALAEFKYAYTEENGDGGNLPNLIDAAIYRVIQRKAQIELNDTVTSSSSSSSSSY